MSQPKLPRTTVIENQVTIAIEASQGGCPTDDIAPCDLENVSGGAGKRVKFPEARALYGLGRLDLDLEKSTIPVK
jgi:hypothetical protein